MKSLRFFKIENYNEKERKKERKKKKRKERKKDDIADVF